MNEKDAFEQLDDGILAASEETELPPDEHWETEPSAESDASDADTQPPVGKSEEADTVTEPTQDEAPELARLRELAAPQIAEIRRWEPGINGVEDFLRMDRAGMFNGYVQRGLTFVEAYRLTYPEKVEASAGAAAARQALNRQQSKAHLQPTAARGAGAVGVPREVLAAYRDLMPEITEAEVSRHYNASLRRR